MTFWIYNPPEPMGTPTEPGPWDAPGQVTPFDSMDLSTRGRCGACSACPKVWRLVVPGDSSDPNSENYSGVFYLNRLPYIPRDPEYPKTGKCAWTSLPLMGFPDAQSYDGDFSEGWTLVFELNLDEGYQWMLYTPRGSDGFSSQQSLYVQAADHWVCLGANSMRLVGDIGDFGHPFTPAVLTITPHPG